MALPTNNNSNDPLKGRNPDENIQNPFDDDDDLDEGLPRGSRQPPAPRLPTAPRGLPTPPAMPARPAPRPPAPEPEDDAFEQIPIEELELEDDYDEPTPPAPQRRAPTPQNPNPQRQARPAQFDDFEIEDTFEPPKQAYKPPVKEEVEEESNFVNEKKKKLSPFGGSKSKKSDLAGKFDERENRKSQAKAVQMGVLTLLVGIVLLGLWNVINPPKGVTLDDVNAVVAANNASNGFPLVEGQAFAESFIQSYLTIDGVEAENADPLLDYYYTGEVTGVPVEPSTVEYENGFGQRLLTPPRTFTAIPVEYNVGSYVVGAMVENYNINNAVDLTGQPPEEVQRRVKWVFFTVNVFWEEDSNQLYIHEDSPQLSPPQPLGAQTDIPLERLPGTGEVAPVEVKERMLETIYPYLTIFGSASINNSSELNIHVVDNPPANVLNGFDGAFSLDGLPAEAISPVEIYYSDVAGTYYADLTVRWRDNYSSESSAIYTTRLLLTMVENSDGDYDVAENYVRKYRPQIDTTQNG